MADTLELIKALPPELQEKILKEYIKIKLKERENSGWGDINEAIIYAPFCETNQQIVKSLFCRKCEECGRNGLCSLCKRNEVDHYLDYPAYWGMRRLNGPEETDYITWCIRWAYARSLYCPKCEDLKRDRYRHKLCNSCKKNLYYFELTSYWGNEEAYFRCWYKQSA